jgi:hypothetical protein
MASLSLRCWYVVAITQPQKCLLSVHGSGILLTCGQANGHACSMIIGLQGSWARPGFHVDMREYVNVSR